MADNIQATPRNYFGGLLSDAYKYMQSPERTQQMQGFAGLLGTTGVPQTIERMAYSEPLTNIGRANVPLLKPETADALMTVAGLAPEIKAAAKMLPKNIPVGMSIKPVDDVVGLLAPQKSFTYPQQEAMLLAQQRAALPVEQGGLGLASNNTAMDRAKAMGFDVDAYHGSKKPNINALDTSKAGENTNKSFDDYLFASTSGENASGYVHDMDFWRGVIRKSPEFKSIEKRESDLIDKRASFREKGDVKGIQGINKQLESVVAERENIYNDFLNGKYGSGEGNAQTVYPLMARNSEFLPSDAAGAGWMRANRPAIDAAEEQGYSGALIKNVRDNAGAWSNVTADTYASKDPDLFRSRFAAFDPFRKTAATAAAMGVAAPDLLAQEQPIITQQKIDDEMMKYGLLGR
jgi:hypothetical protein